MFEKTTYKENQQPSSLAIIFGMEKVQRSSRKGVGSSDPKRRASVINTDDDMILSCMRVQAVVRWYTTQANERDLNMYTIRKSLAERFQNKYEIKDSGCWEWTATKNKYGYALLRNIPNTKPRMIFAHRVSWIIHNGNIPDELYVLHTCDNRKCVNPDHLFLGTKADNSNDRDIKRRQAYGQKNGNAKYTDLDIKNIYAMKDSGMSNPEIAKELNGSRITIWEITTGRKWKHLFAQRYMVNAHV